MIELCIYIYLIKYFVWQYQHEYIINVLILLKEKLKRKQDH
jgi:hypothetical protein